MKESISSGTEKLGKIIRQNYTKIIRVLQIVGAVAIPALLYKFGVDQKDVIILDTIVDPEKTLTVPPTETVAPIVKTDAKVLLDEYLETAKNQEIDLVALSKLNDPTISDQEYNELVSAWENDAVIFSRLTDYAAKMRFIKYVMANDNLDTTPYKSPDYGPDVNGDGKINLRSNEKGETINELGQVVDTTSFICSDFSKELSLRYGIQNTEPLKDYKYQLPMFQVGINEGYVTNDTRQAWGRGHTFNAVFMGGSGDDPTSLRQYVFIEPQNDDMGIVDPMHYLTDGRILTLSVPHLDDWDVGSDSIASYFILPDQELVSIDDKGTQIVNELAGWILMNKGLKPEDDQFMLDEPELLDFNQSDIIRAATLAVGGGYLSKDQVIGAMTDAHVPAGFDYNEFFRAMDAIGVK